MDFQDHLCSLGKFYSSRRAALGQVLTWCIKSLAYCSALSSGPWQIEPMQWPMNFHLTPGSRFDPTFRLGSFGADKFRLWTRVIIVQLFRREQRPDAAKVSPVGR